MAIVLLKELQQALRYFCSVFTAQRYA